MRAPRTRPAARATTGRCSASRSSSRTTSTRPACRRPPARGRSPAATPVGRVHRPAAEGRRRDRHRQGEPVRVGELPVRSRRRAAGAASAARRTWPTCSTATRAARAPGPASSPPRTSPSAAVGTETDGSIVCPSGANGIVGIKPTLGLLSRAGIIPISADQDTAGPMARNVTDAAVLLGAMTGVDPADPATAGQAATPSPTTPRSSTRRARGRDDRRSGSEGTVRSGGQPRGRRDHAGHDRHARSPGCDGRRGHAASRTMSSAPSSTRCCASSRRTSRRISRPTPAAGYPKTLADLIAFNKANPDLEAALEQPDLPWNNAIFEAAEDGRPRSGLHRSPGGRDPRRAGAARRRARRRFDAIIAPTNGPAWVTDPVERRPRRRLLDLRRVVVGVGDHRLGRHHRSGGLRRRRPADRRDVHRRPVGRAGPHRLSPTTSSRHRRSGFRRSSCRRCREVAAG